VLSVITCERAGSKKQGLWLVGAAVTQMSDADASKLTAFLEKRAQSEPMLVLA
jgi:hypothetical protein